jgi:hypothetical protein
MKQSSEYESLLPPYIPTKSTVRALGVLFILSAAVSWVAVGYDFAELRLSTSGHKVVPQVRLAHSRAGSIVAGAQIACLTVTALAFLIWLHRVRVNVRALGVRRLRFGREWTFLGFLIPLLNALRPYQVIQEIWKASDPSTGDPIGWRTVPTPPLLALWWSLFVAYFVLEACSLFTLRVAVTLPRIQMAHVMGLTADVCAALAASFAYFVVLRISEAQEAKRNAWGRGASGAMPFDPRDAVA